MRKTINLDFANKFMEAQLLFLIEITKPRSR